MKMLNTTNSFPGGVVNVTICVTDQLVVPITEVFGATMYNARHDTLYNVAMSMCIPHQIILGEYYIRSGRCFLERFEQQFSIVSVCRVQSDGIGV